MKTIERKFVPKLLSYLSSPSNLMQVVMGPRQVGKTTGVQQVIKKWAGPVHYASADLPSPPDSYWITTQWQMARQAAKGNRKSLLVLDEVQKIPHWNEVVKALYDGDKLKKQNVRVVLLGSSSMTLHRGSNESLAGRFETHFCGHWSWSECREAFKWGLEDWIFFGGYPGAAPLVKDHARWRDYVLNSLIESVLSRDVLQVVHIAKPALLRQLFLLAAHLPSQILSYNKMLGQLQDAGNTVTLAHYLNLLDSAFLISGLQQWSSGPLRVRASSPKFILWNNALITAFQSLDRNGIRNQPMWGRLVENAVGAYVLNQRLPGVQLFYWRRDKAEVDFVIQRGDDLLLIEVKSGQPKFNRGFDAFRHLYPKAQTLIVGEGGVPLEKFFSISTQEWFS